jgi:hypothetical protein
MPLPSTPVEVRFAQTDQRKFGKFLLPGQLDIAQNVHQPTEGLIEKRDGYATIAETAAPGDPAIVDPTDVGMAGEAMAQVAGNGLYLRGPSDTTWRRAEQHEQAFATFETVIADAGFRPSRLTDGNGNVWHFSASQAIDPSTGSTMRRPVYRVVAADGRELVPVTQIANVPIYSGKPLLVGTRLFFYYQEGSVGIHCATFDTATPTVAPTTALVLVETGVFLGFDVRVVPDTSAGLLMFWGINVNGGTAAIGVSRLHATTGAVVGVAYSSFPGNLPALTPGVLCRTDAAGRGFLGAVAANDASDRLYAVEINTGTLACAFTQLTLGDFTGVHQLGAVVDGGSLEIFWADCREMMDPSTLMPAPQPALWQLSLDLATSTPTSDFLMYGPWLAAEPVMYDGRILLILGHESRFSATNAPAISPQRSYSLFDVDAEKFLCRAMYETGGGDGDSRAGAGLGFVQGCFVAPVEVDGDLLTVNLNACRDGLHDFYTVALTFDLDPDIGPAVQVEDKLFIPGGYPRWLGAWGRALDVAPQVFPEYVRVTAASGVGFPTYNGTFQVTATYAFVAPDGSEIECTAAQIEDIVTAGGTQWVRVEVPTAYQFAGSDSGIKCFIRVYSTTDGGSSLMRQATKANRTDVRTVTFDLPAIGVGPTLYQEGEIEHVPCPPCRQACYWDQRLFVSDLAETGVVTPSNYIDRGRLPAFISDGRFTVGARVRAMCPVSRDYLAIFHDSGVAVVPRGGHTLAGTNPYVPIHLPNVTQTTRNARSVAATEKGCVFQGTDGGIYLLTSSLQVVFIGRGVDDRSGETVTSAVYLPKVQHVRLTTSAGNVLTFDIGRLPAVQQTVEDTIGQWYTWPLSVTGGMAAAMVKDDAHYILAGNGAVWNQVAGQAFDGVSTFIPMKVRLPLSFQGIVAYLRCLRGILLYQWVGPHVLQLTVDMDGNATPLDPKVMASATARADFRPNPSKASHFVLTIEEQQHEGLLNKGLRLEGLGFEVQRQPGLARGQTRIE